MREYGQADMKRKGVRLIPKSINRQLKSFLVQ
jgi:hypothetical protein